MSKIKSIGTFAPNHSQHIHGWYPYIEGYASDLVSRELAKLDKNKINLIYDPFGGTGTTPLVAATSGFDSLYSETNPFMRQVIDAKTNGVKVIAGDEKRLHELIDLLSFLSAKRDNAELLVSDIKWGGFEKYFYAETLSQILFVKAQIDQRCNGAAKDIAMVALSSILVPVSLMTRRGDLRFAKDSELEKKEFDAVLSFCNKLKTVISDIAICGNSIRGNVTCASEDSRDIPEGLGIDCVITSPPYLNGTNYIRNTKLELKLNDYVDREADLSHLHAKGIVAGINNVNKATARHEIPNEVTDIYNKLIPVAYDKRIPTMVASYFGDMNDLFTSLAASMSDGGYFIMDIGDSQFAGVHIPTHKLLETIAAPHGFTKYSEDTLRERRSRNGMILTQKLLRFRLVK